MGGNERMGTQNPEPPTPGAPLLSVRELAAFLRVHEKTIYNWVARDRLPCIRLGNRLRFDQNDVLRWLSALKEGETC